MVLLDTPCPLPLGGGAQCLAGPPPPPHTDGRPLLSDPPPHGGGGGGGLATSVCQPRHDAAERGPTEPHTGRSTFLLSSGGVGGRVLLSGRCYGAVSY